MTNIFQYLENKKGKPIPLIYKLLNNIPLNENELIINGDLYLSYTKITSLPNNLTVNGCLYLRHSDIISLPNNLTVNRYLSITLTKISELPDDLIVYGDLWCYHTPLANNIKNDISLLIKYKQQIKGNICYIW